MIDAHAEVPLARSLLAEVNRIDSRKKLQGAARARQRWHIHIAAIELLQKFAPKDIVALFNRLLDDPMAVNRIDQSHAKAWDKVLNYAVDHPRASDLKLAGVLAGALGGMPDSYRKQIAAWRRKPNTRAVIAYYRKSGTHIHTGD